MASLRRDCGFAVRVAVYAEQEVGQVETEGKGQVRGSVHLFALLVLGFELWAIVGTTS